MKIVIFMPFDPNGDRYAQVKVEYGGGEMHKNKKVKEFLVKRGHAVDVVWYDGKRKPAIASLDSGAIYIRGHGMAGDEVLKGVKNGGETVHYQTAYNRLRESGLSKSYSGEVHSYNCHSAEHGQLFGQPYAVNFSNYMFTKGFKACKFFGYLGPLDSFPKPGSQGTNIYSRQKTVQVVDGKRKEVLVERGTWDQARVTIHPVIDMRTTRQKIRAFFGK